MSVDISMPRALATLVFIVTATSFSNLQAQWDIQPFIVTELGYSDNIELDGEDEESGFVGTINPGLAITKDTGRLRVQLDYLMENFYYFDESELDTSHDLDAITQYAVIPENFFINSFAQAEQVVVDNDRQISVDNFNNTGNTTDQYFYGIGPQWIQDFGGYVRADLAYLYSQERFDEETADEIDEGDIDNNDRQNFLASLSNINKESDRFDWTASYEWEEIDFDFGDEFEFITQQLDVGYQILSRLELVGSYGYEDNDLGENIVLNDDDGVFWTAGAILGIGQFTTLEVRRGDRFFGNFWLGELDVDGPKLEVNVTYEEATDIPGSTDIEFGLDERSSALDLLDNTVELSPDDRNSVSTTKSWEASVSYNISKSTFIAEVRNDDEEFLDTGNTEQLEEYSLGWIWQITGISSLTTIAEFQEDESQVGSTTEKSDFFNFDVEYQRSLSPKTDFLLSYIYTEGDSDEFDDDFTSNTVIAGLEYRF